MAHIAGFNLNELAGKSKEEILEIIKQQQESAAKLAQYEKLGISVTAGKAGKARKVMFKMPNAYPVTLTLDNWKTLQKAMPLILEANEKLLTADEVQAQRDELQDD